MKTRVRKRTAKQREEEEMYEGGAWVEEGGRKGR